MGRPVLLSVTALLLGFDAFTAWTQTIFFFASAAAGSAYLTVSEIRVGAVDHRFAEARRGDAGFEIVADRLSRGAAEISKCANVRGDPVRQALREGRFRVGVVAAPSGRLSRRPPSQSGVRRLAGVEARLNRAWLKEQLSPVGAKIRPGGIRCRNAQ
jgi:hypothetical protein